MRQHLKIKLIFLILIVFVLIVFAGLFIHFEKNNCMGVAVISENKLEELSESKDIDISQLKLNGEKIAADIENNTVYISQLREHLSDFSKLEGKIESSKYTQTLFFIDNEKFNNIATTVKNGETLSLAIIENNCYKIVNVAITNLPVFNMDGDVAYIDGEGREVFSGSATLWSSFDPSIKGYSTKNSKLNWHVRGYTSAIQDKKPWKLSFKNNKGQNKNIEFLGLGEDDDWILNSLVMDDTSLKEKLFMDVWNEFSADTEYNYKMSCGEYVEAVINGKYVGLFLLQRRLDAKYFELSDEDVVLKAIDYEATCAEEAYEFVTPPKNTEEIYKIMQGVFACTDCSGYNLHNVIDVNLMIQFANARDNFSLKNMYHVLKKTDDGYKHFLVPWDVDQSFGVVWKMYKGFCYDYDQSMREFAVRTETGYMKKMHPNYNQVAAERWFELRNTVFNEENMINRINALHLQIEESGALKRDTATWGLRYGGEESVESLKRFVRERLKVMDEYYNNLNK